MILFALKHNLPWARKIKKDLKSLNINNIDELEKIKKELKDKIRHLEIDDYNKKDCSDKYSNSYLIDKNNKNKKKYLLRR